MFKSTNVPKREKDCLNFRRFEIFTIDLRIILSIIVAIGVYALLLKFLQKNSPLDVQMKGGGGQRPFEQCSKKLHFSYGTASLTHLQTVLSSNCVSPIEKD